MRYDLELKVEVPVLPYSPDVSYLAERGVFRPVNPEEFIALPSWWERAEELAEELKRIVSSNQFSRTLPGRWRRHTARIHRTKVIDKVMDWLSERHLAKEDPDDREWLRFEQRTGLLYMALLAKYLADSDARGKLPCTDSKTYESLIFGSETKKESFTCFDVYYRNTLPIPKDTVSLEDILAFKAKEENRLALLRFRRLLDEVHTKISEAEKQSELSQILVGFKEKIELGVKELGEILSDSRVETTSGCLKTLVNIKSPALLAGAAVLAGQATSLAMIPLVWALPGIGIVGAIQVGHHLVHRTNKQRAVIRGSDFAYLYHAKESGII